jgi:hypothetical protein
MLPTSAQVPLMGVPGEVQNLVTMNIRAGDLPLAQPPKPWRPGQYRVQLMLGRPGYPINPEYKHSFIGTADGSSHLRIVKPLAQRTVNDPDHMLWWSSYVDKSGKRTDLQFKGEANAEGFLAKFSTSLDANDANEAASTAHASLAPLLSGLAASVDVPLFIESIDAVESATGNAMVRIVAPFPEQIFNFGPLPNMTEEYCHYTSLYREALQTNSSFYRFLCLFKIIEGIHKRRGRLTLEAKKRGDHVPRKTLIPERVPAEKSEQIRLLKAVYSVRADTSWDDMFVGQTFPGESRGKSVKEIRDTILEKIRDTIAHGVMLDGEPGLSVDDLKDQWKVNNWLPLLRFLTRLMLTNEFPVEFQLGTKVKYEP